MHIWILFQSSFTCKSKWHVLEIFLSSERKTIFRPGDDGGQYFACHEHLRQSAMGAHSARQIKLQIMSNPLVRLIIITPDSDPTMAMTWPQIFDLPHSQPLPRRPCQPSGRRATADSGRASEHLKSRGSVLEASCATQQLGAPNNSHLWKPAQDTIAVCGRPPPAFDACPAREFIQFWPFLELAPDHHLLTTVRHKTIICHKTIFCHQIFFCHKTIFCHNMTILHQKRLFSIKRLFCWVRLRQGPRLTLKEGWGTRLS